MKNFLKLVNEYWGALVIIGSLFSTFLVAMWVAFAVPIINDTIDARVLIIGRDSMPAMVHNILKTQPVGFRGGLSDTTKIPKDLLVGVLGNMILQDSKKEKDILDLQYEVDYLDNFTLFLLKTLYQRVEYDQVPFFVTEKGTYMYLDMYKKLWDASYNAECDCFYYYPNYANGQRLDCEKW